MSTLRIKNIAHPSAEEDQIVLNSDSVELPASTTIDGDAVTTSSSVSTQIAEQAPIYTNRNLLYNGAMQVHQRGTSVSGITGLGYYTADRFNTLCIAMGTWTNTIENDAPAGSGFRKSFKLLCTAADPTPDAFDQIRIDQYLEGQDLQRIKKGTSDAEQLTMSFWVKSNVTGTYVCGLSDVDNSRNVNAQYTINATDTWEKKTITFPADTTGVFDNDNASSMQIRWYLGAGADLSSGTLQTTWGTAIAANAAVGQTNVAAATNNYWQITGVQLEVGPVATEFEFKSFGQELRECQRYYYLHAGFGIFSIASGSYWQSNNAYCYIKFPVSMRIGPNLVSSSGTDYYGFNSGGGIDLFNDFNQWLRANPNGGLLGVGTNVSGTAGAAGDFYTNNAAAFVAFTAEL